MMLDRSELGLAVVAVHVGMIRVQAARQPGLGRRVPGSIFVFDRAYGDPGRPEI